MPGTTTELSLSTAVDSDDNADYLTISLANSLRTLDALFNNVSGHTHSGAHQGGPISPAAGSIPGSALANGSVTNAKLASDTARENLLTNGGFEIWQRGTGPFTAMNVYTADRWQISGAAGDTISISKDTSNSDGSSGACAAVTFTKGSGTTGLVQYPGRDNQTLIGKTLTLSIRIRTSVANLVRVALHSGSAWTYSAFHSGSGTYQTLTATVNAVSGAQMGDCAVWFDGGGSGTIYIDNAMLVVGSVAADYAPLHPADDLARCLRYYEKIGGVFVNYPIIRAYNLASGTFGANMFFKVVKAVAPPTITKVGTWQTINCGQPVIGGGDASSFELQATATAQGFSQFYASDSSQYITIEANP